MKKSFICFYFGSYGPTIRIDIQTMDMLLFTQNIFKDFLSDSQGISSLHLFNEFDIIGIDSFALIKSSSPDKYALECSISSNNITVNMIIGKNYIENIIELIDILVETDLPGHQYLSHESDGVLIELAYREERPYNK